MVGDILNKYGFHRASCALMNIHQNKLNFGPKKKIIPQQSNPSKKILYETILVHFPIMSCIVNFLPVNFGKCMTMSQPPGLLPAFINFKWLTQIIDVEVVWCEVLSHHPFCTTVDLTGQKKRLYIFCHINLIMVSDSDGFIVVCFDKYYLLYIHDPMTKGTNWFSSLALWNRSMGGEKGN